MDAGVVVGMLLPSCGEWNNSSSRVGLRILTSQTLRRMNMSGLFNPQGEDDRCIFEGELSQREGTEQIDVIFGFSGEKNKT